MKRSASARQRQAVCVHVLERCVDAVEHGVDCLHAAVTKKRELRSPVLEIVGKSESNEQECFGMRSLRAPKLFELVFDDACQSQQGVVIR